MNPTESVSPGAGLVVRKRNAMQRAIRGFHEWGSRNTALNIEGYGIITLGLIPVVGWGLLLGIYIAETKFPRIRRFFLGED